MFGLFKKKDAIHWRESKSGNLTFREGEWRVTVYSAKDPKGYAYVISIGDGDDEEAYFSRRFKTQDDAIGPAEEVFRAATSGGIKALEKAHANYA